MLAIGAGPAMAEVHWSDTENGIKVSGTLTAYKDGSSAKTCTAVKEQISEFYGVDGMIRTKYWELIFPCSGGGWLGIDFYFNPIDTTTLEVGAPYEAAHYPWGSLYSTYLQGSCWFECPTAIGDFSNGAGEKPSTLTFSEDALGTYPHGEYPIVSISGTLDVTTSSGGLLTLEE